ncbi:proline and serine-rich protein 2 isoform X2 [Tachyglossus aculeatus]|uniref:proline and serine-rich protein 2 isoform X2 n=1 Tax=Tachyglossus aculeatus TaxID=9261 RepID=UPI0018F6B9F4|nr:proline and serine-rich protein 2 isoform X2 [Tachyglossus aculeatus]
MPRNLLKSDFSEMDSDMSPNCKLSDSGRGGSLESRSSGSRTRSFTLDDESLQFLTHEEKDVLLFFEETIDSLENELDDPTLNDSGIHCHSPKSLEESASSHSESEDIIDLVRRTPETGEVEQPRDMSAASGLGISGKVNATTLALREQVSKRTLAPDSAVSLVTPLPPSPPLASAPVPSRKDFLSPSPPAEHPRLLRSVPTPLIIAQKISEMRGGSEGLSPTSPSKEGKLGEWRTLSPVPSSALNGDHFQWHRHPATLPAPKVHRFPSNISVTNSTGKEFNKTISKAAVSVQERKAQVLANINGVAFLMGEVEDQPQRNDVSNQWRSTSPKDVVPEQNRDEVPGFAKEVPGLVEVDKVGGGHSSKGQQRERPEPVSNGYQNINEVLKRETSPFVSTGKTITFRPEAASINSKISRQNATKSFYEHRQGDFGQDVRKRTSSLPRVVGFRPQGITVQFSGRGSTEEARREALRKLGLLKETS